MFAKSASCGLHRKKTKALSFCLFAFGTARWSHAFCCVMASMQGKEGNAPYFDSFFFCMVISSSLAVYVQDGKGRHT